MTKCRKGPRCCHDSGGRKKLDIAFHCIHAAEGSSAASVASYLHKPISSNIPGSVHRCIDDKECVRTLPDLITPWAAPPINLAGIHDELSAFSRWSLRQWYKHLPMLRIEAQKIARDCFEYDIPLRWLSARKLKVIGPNPNHRNGGVTDHVQVTKAFDKSDHTDPGEGFELSIPGKRSPHSYLMFWAKRYLKQLEAARKR